MPKGYPQDQREVGVRMVLDHLSEYDAVFAAFSAVEATFEYRQGVPAPVGSPAQIAPTDAPGSPE
ncbi:MAG: hypothetical protein JWO93_2989 [Micrococcaceae bacterium]|nr:hypothetical protein [Micrococcaceae bacterium]